MVMINLSSITAAYGDTTVLSNFNLEVEQGEFLTFLGPSGCGKSTLLRIIAGFLTPTAGTVSIEGVDVTAVSPERRPVGIVFQGYALFPHLSVEANVEFGLKARRVPVQERRQRVAASLESFGLDALAGRAPADLSGGQQQRVAIARAVVNETPVLLMDEPLSNLDTSLRMRLRDELRTFHEKHGITTVFVTHDQEEALSLSDRIVVLLDGEIAQLGTPHEVYHQPASSAVCTFIGRANRLGGSLQNAFGLPDSKQEIPFVRPERVLVGDLAINSDHSAVGHVVDAKFVGPNQELTVGIGEAVITSSVVSSSRQSYEAGMGIQVGFAKEDVIWVRS